MGQREVRGWPLMSGAVVVGLIAGVGMFLGAGFGWLRLRRDAPAARFRRADRWAREVDLALPPELVEPLSDRLRQRATATMVGMAVLVAPVWGITAWYNVSRSVDAPQSPFTGPGLAVWVSAPMLLVGVLAHLWEVGHQRRKPGPRVARLEQLRLRDMAPLSVIRLTRGAAVVLPLAGVGLQLWLQHEGYDRGAGFYGYGVVLLLCVLGVNLVERRQTVILNGPQRAGSPQELAFDDVFRIETALSLGALLPVLSCLASSFLLQPVFDAVPYGSIAGVDTLYPWGLLSLGSSAGYLLTVRRISRRYRGRTPRPPMSEPPTPETAPC